jgi:steroid delta-isomerase-like uncharacterized protein
MHTNEATMRRWFEEVWNQRQVAAIDEILAPDCPIHGLGPAPLIGGAGFRVFHQAFGRAFPDLHLEVLSVVVGEDDVAVRFRSRGTHTGDTMGPPSGKPISVEGVTFARFRDGRAIEAWNLVDFLGMYQQLGWVAANVGPA